MPSNEKKSFKILSSYFWKGEEKSCVSEGTVIPVQEELQLLGVTLHSKLMFARARFVKSFLEQSSEETIAF